MCVMHFTTGGIVFVSLFFSVKSLNLGQAFRVYRRLEKKRFYSNVYLETLCSEIHEALSLECQFRLRRVHTQYMSSREGRD